MSKIFQALEKAQVERALHEHGSLRRDDQPATPPPPPSSIPQRSGQKMTVKGFKSFLAQLPDDAILEVRLDESGPLHFAQWKPLAPHEIRAVVQPAPAAERSHDLDR